MGLALTILTLAAFVVCALLTGLLVRIGTRAGTLDSAGVAGQQKVARKVPNIGGISLALTLLSGVGCAAMLAALPTLWGFTARLLPATEPHLQGLRTTLPTILTLLASLAWLHTLGLIDDRRPLPALPKLLAMLVPAIAISLTPGTRLLTALDPHVGGSWLSMFLTVVWFVVITNALNFLDNMDGLSAGVAMIAAGIAGAGAASRGQWFVAGLSLLLAGACAGFLLWNFPWSSRGARIFMGDGGSLLLGFTLATIAARGTYAQVPLGASLDGLPWHSVLLPLAILSVPLYDFASVCVVRLRAGRSPMVGDRNHLSHRLTRRGLSPRNAVLLIHALTAMTGLSGLLLPSLDSRGALLVGGQIVLTLLVVAMLEFGGQSPLAAYPKQERTP